MSKSQRLFYLRENGARFVAVQRLNYEVQVSCTYVRQTRLGFLFWILGVTGQIFYLCGCSLSFIYVAAVCLRILLHFKV